MATHYVRAGATGTANGSDWTNAYTTLPAALIRGDTYYIADGSYGGHAFNDAASGTTLITVKKAISTDHGTNTGWTDAFGAGQAIFTDTLSYQTPYYVLDGQVGGGPGSWTSGHGFKVTTGNNYGIIVNAQLAFTSHHVTVSHTEILGNGGTTAGSDTTNVFITNNVTFRYCYIYGSGRTIGWANTADAITYEYNYMGKFHSDATQHAEIFSWDGVSNMIVRYNIFTHAEGTGGIIIHNPDGPVAIYGNAFHEGLTTPWIGNNGLIGGFTTGNTLKDVTVYNNTFINVTIPVFGGTSQFFSGNIIRNNLFYTVTNPGGGDQWPVITHNHFITTPLLGTDTSTGSGNPFVNYPALDYRLLGATPAGFTLAIPYTTDMLGNLRGADGTWDRGALEFVGITVPTAPKNLSVR